MLSKLLISSTDFKDYKVLYNNMVNDNFELKRVNDDLKDEIAQLKEELSSSKDLLDMQSRNLEYLKNTLNDLETYSDKLEFQIDDLNKELKEYNPNLKPTKKKVTKEKIIEVKSMIQKGNTYRVTSQETHVSIKTISRIMNGYYD